MPKPGQTSNKSYPTSTGGLSAIDQVSKTSLNTPETLQTSQNPNRLAPDRRRARSEGNAPIEFNDNLPSNMYTPEGTKAMYDSRRKHLR